MRDLTQTEVQFVTGAGPGCSPAPPTRPVKKGNNGFGNGPDTNTAAPGNSGTTGGGKDNSTGGR